MTLKWLFFLKKLRNMLSDWGLCPQTSVHITLELHPFAQHAAQLQLFRTNYFNFWFKTSSKILVAAVKFIRSKRSWIRRGVAKGDGGGRHSECHYFEVAPFHDTKQTNKKTIRLISLKMFSKPDWTKKILSIF